MKKTLLGLGTLALVFGTMGVFSGTALAYQGNPNIKGPFYTAERHAAMEKAFEDKDFDAWKNLTQGRGRMTAVVNKDNFAKFAEAHELAEQGNFAEAQKIRAELGLGLRDGSGHMNGKAGMGIGFGR
jgi:hypothetical protein